MIALLLAWLCVEGVSQSAEIGGYVRVASRPDLQGGAGQLGYWNLYGRLLNEGPWVAVEWRQALLERSPGSEWAALHARIEGGSVANADPNGGSLQGMKLARLYVNGGSPGLARVTWQVGTLETWMGDLGLYDMRPAGLLDDTLGASARYRGESLDVLVAVGDSGYGIEPGAYTSVLTGGGQVRLRIFDGLELGLGGQFNHEPSTTGNRNGAYKTRGVSYEDLVRGEIVQTWLESSQDLSDFPNPTPVTAQSWKAIGYLGFGGLGPLTWSSLFASAERAHPEGPVTQEYEGSAIDVHQSHFTDERDVLTLGNEMQFSVVDERLDAVWAVLYGRHTDGDNALVPSEHVRSYYSTVLRAQAYLSRSVHFLVESSVAEERSDNGLMYRNHANSVFQTSDGLRQDERGLQWGDSDTRRTWQGKAGVVFNPLGPGIYVRPSLRLLYGAQFSTENLAYGNSFVETLDQHSDFSTVESHWHQVIAVETEAWF